MTDLQRIVAVLKQDGFEIETVEDGALVNRGGSRVALFTERDEGQPEAGLIVRLHLDLDLYVDEDALSDVLLGVNLMNQALDFGHIVLDPLEPEDEEAEDVLDEDAHVTFAVLGRSVFWLRDTSPEEIARLERHLGRFEAEVSDAVERSLHGPKSMKA